MIKHTDAFGKAVVADARRVRIRANIAIIDPDIAFGAASSSGAASWSRLDELINKDSNIESKYQSLERNRFVLDGSFLSMPSDGWDGETAYCSSDICGSDGTFENPQFVELRFSGVSILQSASVFFANDSHDGVPEDFTVEILQNGTSYFSKSFEGNKESGVTVDGFTVYNPTAIRLTVHKWSLPYRRARVAEIVPGAYEEWSDDDIASLEIRQQCDFSNTSVPYGTCVLTIDNQNRRFEPRSKNGLFQSLEERQGIEISLGVDLPDGNIEWIPVGTYFQHDNGWTTGENGLTMRWNLVDIIGLLSDRKYNLPDVLPTTLGGWVESIVGHLGSNFARRWSVDPDYINTDCQAPRQSILKPDPDTGEIKDRTCGEMLRYVCMACGVFPRADSRNGNLLVEPLWNDGNQYDLDNIEKYPTMSKNDDVATIECAGYEFSGNEISSGNSIKIDNPFLTNTEKINNAVRSVLSIKGGNVMSTTGRGNPTSEVGDVGKIWLDESQVTTGRVVSQSFTMTSGVLRGCQTQFLQADGSFMWEKRQKFTSDGTFVVPDGVSKLRLILVGHGQDGKDGYGGHQTIFFEFDQSDGLVFRPSFIEDVDYIHWTKDFHKTIEKMTVLGTTEAEDGADGLGGLVWTGTVDVNPNEEIAIHIGENPNDPTTASVWSSANGIRYPRGYADINASEGFARTGVDEPIDGSGDGGKGGRGGQYPGTLEIFDIEGTDPPEVAIWFNTGYSEKGTKGAKGCAIVYWE